MRMEAVGQYKWTITGFSRIKETKKYSDDFIVGDKNWRLLVFPKGNNCDFLSLYLDFSDSRRLTSNWSCCAQFALIVVNPNDETIAIHKEAKHRFNPDESDWGFTQFVKLSTLYNETKTPNKDFIVDDTLVIIAVVRIVKDITGNLWHSFVNYDSKRETGYVGLKNQGATCYMNSILQSLYFLKYFRKAVFKMPTEVDEVGKSVPLALQRIFFQLQNSDQAASTTELTKSFGWDTLDSFMQHDVQEFNRVLCDNLETKMKGTSVEGTINDLFEGKMKSYIRCIDVPYESSRIESFYDVQLNVKGMKTVYDSFKDYVSEETLEGDNKYFAEGYGLQSAKKGVVFEKFPPVLHLQLKRFEYDVMRDAMVKVNDRLEFPPTIDLDEFLSPSADKSIKQRYHLLGVLVHSGDVHSGHYCAFLRPEKDGKWYKFDDDRVTIVTEREALNENYGDSEISTIGAGGRPIQKLHRRFTNAYMLVYVREVDFDRILCHIPQDVLPVHIKQRLEQERELEEMRRKEKEEQFLTMKIRVLTDDIIKRHSGADLVNIDEKAGSLTDMPLFKIRLDESFAAFKLLVAEQLRIPPERQRYWILVARQNRTIRPSELVTNEHSAIQNALGDSDRMVGELRVYLEESPISSEEAKLTGKPFFSENDRNHALLFIKYYDPTKQVLEFLGHFMVNHNQKLADLVPTLLRMKDLPPETQIKFYEEVRPVLINPIKPSETIKTAELGDGDIICFQKELTPMEVAHFEYPYAPHFYDYLVNRVEVHFKPKNKVRDDDDEFSLIMNKKWNYHHVASRLAERLHTDPMKIRFFAPSPYSDLPKSPIRRSTVLTLNDMLQSTYYGPSSDTLFFEKLDVSIVEMENMRSLKIVYLNWRINEEESIELPISRVATVSDVMRTLKEKLMLDEPHSGQFRLFEVYNNKILKIYNPEDPVSIFTEYGSVYCEEIPSEELYMQKADRLITAIHYYKDPFRTHSIPFYFVLKAKEPFSLTKHRLRQRLGVSEKEFEKYRIAIIHEGKPRPIVEDNEILAETLAKEDLLGLDHPDRRRTDRSSTFERAIVIKN